MLSFFLATLCIFVLPIKSINSLQPVTSGPPNQGHRVVPREIHQSHCVLLLQQDEHAELGTPRRTLPFFMRCFSLATAQPQDSITFPGQLSKMQLDHGTLRSDGAR